MPKISVIIPFYNRTEKTVSAINSVLAQTFTDYEIIVINDGSEQDVTPVSEIAKQHPHIIKFISYHVNKGVSSARNTGVENALGEYIAFLDSDDLFLPQKLEKQLKELQQKNIGFSHTSYIKKQGDIEQVIDTSFLTGNAIPEIIFSCPIATPTVMIKKDILVNNNIKFNTSTKYGEDTVFWMEISKFTHIAGMAEPLSIVNVSGESCVSNSDKQIEGYKAIINYVINDEVYKKFDIEISKLFERFVKIVNNTPQYTEYKKAQPKNLLTFLQKPLNWLELKHNKTYCRLQKIYRFISKKV